jgi:hypothetical protein
MTSEQWERVVALYDQARTHPPAERGRFLGDSLPLASANRRTASRLTLSAESDPTRALSPVSIGRLNNRLGRPTREPGACGSRRPTACGPPRLRMW